MRMSSRHRPEQGFTLVEIAVVLVIIGLILGGVLNAQSVLRNARTKDVTKAVSDMATASQQFRDRYGAWPGTLVGATTSIPDLSAACVGNATGVIGTAVESRCATEELIRASMLRGDALSPLLIHGTVTVSLTSRAAVAVLPGLATVPANWINVVRVQNIDCDSALQMDRTVDDGIGTTGNFRIGTATGLPCPGQDESIVVANAVLRLN